MGGSFNPFHLAHLNSLLTVKELFHLENIILIPSFQTPLKAPTKNQEIEPFHRLEMLKQAVSSYPFITVDDQEICRRGMSYTYKTISQVVKQNRKEELFFIMGLDQFYTFDKWKHFEKILQKTNLIVTSYPGQCFPLKRDHFPKGLKPLIKKSPSKFIPSSVLSKNPSSQSFPFFFVKSESASNLKPKSTSRKIYFCSLKDMDISSSYVRQRLRERKEVSHLLPKAVDLYIQTHKLYIGQDTHIKNQSQKLIDFSIKELKKKKAYDIKTYDLRAKPLPFSFGLIASASNTRQVKASAVHLKREIKSHLGLNPIKEEGREESRWVVFDYGDLVIHIFYDYTRKFYKLEGLWESPE